MDKICCIYKIENRINGNVYIGGTTDFHRRVRQHRYCLVHKNHPSQLMQDDFDSQGKHIFKFEVIEEIKKDKLEEREQYWLDTLHPEYNTSRFSKKPDEEIVFSKDANKRRSETVKKLWQDPEYRESHCKPRNWKDGVPNRKGVKLSNETKEKIRQANLGENNPHYGKPRGKSFLKKMQKEYPGAIAPDGTVYAPIVGLNAFCREHNLDTGGMSRLMSGRVKTYKGWRKYDKI